MFNENKKSTATKRDFVSVRTALKEKHNQHNLIGCSLSWFIYDVVLYGTVINLPEILTLVFENHSDNLETSSWHDLTISLLGMPGILFAIYVLDYLSISDLQVYGFVAIGSVCAGLALTMSDLVTVNRSIMILLSCSLMFFLSWGCGLSTYILPMEVFDGSIRSSFHGISAATGKLGGFFGGIIFTYLSDVSISLTFAVCSFSCFIGIWITYRYVNVPVCQSSSVSYHIT